MEVFTQGFTGDLVIHLEGIEADELTSILDEYFSEGKMDHLKRRSQKIRAEMNLYRKDQWKYCDTCRRSGPMNEHDGECKRISVEEISLSRPY